MGKYVRLRKEHVGEHGLQSRILRKLARLYGLRAEDGTRVSPIRQGCLSDIMHGKRRPTPEQAIMLEAVFHELGYAISKFDMIFAFVKDRSILELDKTRES